MRNKILDLINNNFFFQFYNDNGRDLLYFKSFESLKSIPSEETTYARGIATIGDDSVVIGTSSGTIYYFELTPSDNIANIVSFKKEITPRGLNSGIFNLSSTPDGTILCGSDTCGNIFVWNFTKTLDIKHLFPANQYNSK